MTPELVMAARVGLRMSKTELARAASVSVGALSNLEANANWASTTLNNVVAVLTDAGACFEVRDGRVWVGLPAPIARVKRVKTNRGGVRPGSGRRKNQTND